MLGYVLRNLVVRARTTITTVLVIALTTAAITTVLGVARGLKRTLEGPNRPDLAVVVNERANDDADSFVTPDALARVRVAPGIATSGGLALVSPELSVRFPTRRIDGSFDNVRVRGVDPIAYQLHPEVKLTSGSLPAQGERGVVVGARLVGQFEHVEIGGKFRIGRHLWPITGIISAPEEPADSEVWCDRALLQDELGEKNSSVLLVKLDSPQRIDELRSVVKNMREYQLLVMTPFDFHKRAIAQVTLYTSAITFVIWLLCVSATIAGTNATYSMFLVQMVELGTLLAIGFSRGKIARMVLVQSVILAALGAAIGLGLAILANGYAITSHEMMLVYRVRIDLQVLLLGTLSAITIGIASSFVSVLQTYQLNVLSVLRD